MQSGALPSSPRRPYSKGGPMEQQRLFVLALEAIALTAYHEPAHGWRLVIQSRRQGDEWQDSDRATYSHLTTDELADVVCAEVARRLDLV